MKLIEINESYLSQIKALYEESGWTAYLADDEKLSRAIKNSLLTLGYMDDDELVCFVRCVGDAEHVVLVQDLIVKKDYRRNGLAKKLMNEVFEKYKDVRWIQVNTDAMDEVANAFYRAIGMKEISEAGTVSYFK
ncbi:GNAT family N-acetyltransferase [Fenollaria timonensis]|uniref:GNAT family N-acetyltransferase n=1 Tax=Fenollaria timonensis TaxID=1723384 RepID=UPI00071DC44F|nr:GNAT family N-acetyltransferase [Fenollaria timonensis]